MATDPLDMVKGVVLEAKARLSAVVPDTASSTDTAAVRAARPLLRTAFTAWDTITETLQNLAAQLALVMNDARWSPGERDNQLRAAANTARATTSTAFDTMETSLEQLRVKLTALAGVQRPAPIDATQEATIAGLKADWQMVLNNVAGADVIDRLVTFARGALSSGDLLAGWVLTSSGWPALYLESRGLDDYVVRLDQELGALLDTTDAGAAAARTVLAVIDSPKGLAGAIVGARTYLRMALDDLTLGVPA